MESLISVLKRGRLFVTALASVAVLLGVAGFSTYRNFSTPAPIPTEATSTAETFASYVPPQKDVPRWQSELLRNSEEISDDVALRGVGDAVSEGIAVSYNALQQAGGLNAENIDRVTNNMAEGMRLEPVFTSYTQEDISVDSNTSYTRMLEYRSAMRIALEPLLENKESEFEIYARYIDTKNKKYLQQLATSSDNYYRAIERAVKVSVPIDAQIQHLHAVNSLLEFATVLDDIVNHASDPLASVVLLRTYTIAETKVYTAFNELARYYATKKNT